MVKVAAVGDIHSPKFLEDFKTCMRVIEFSTIDLFLLAGDLILKGQFQNISNVLNVLDENDVSCPIISCFGNEEYSEIREQIRSVAGTRIKFLDDESTLFQVDNSDVGIVGSQGSLEKPTPWQAKNIFNIEEIYAQRISRILQLLTDLKTDVKILLTHYPPTYRVLKGEKTMFYPHIGCHRCERIISESTVNAVICAHTHVGIPYAVVNGVPVYNVSLPAVRKISLIEVSNPKMLNKDLKD